MKVLQLYYEPTPAGQTRHVIALSRALARHGHHVTVVLPERLQPYQASIGPDLSWPALEQAGVEIVPLPLRKLLWPLQTSRALWQLVHRLQPQVLHVHSLEAGVSGRVVGSLAKTVHRIHTHVVYTPQTIDIRRTSWHWLYVYLERILSRLTDTTISVTETDRRRLLRWGVPMRKVVTIPNGVELEAIADYPSKPSARRALGLDPDRPVVMQVARLSAQKDPLAFVDGAAIVAQLHPETQFVMIGQGPLRDTVASRIRSVGLRGKVHLLGWREQARRLMAAADLVTLTSRWEGAPYSLLEAMAASRPVVTTAVNGCPEIVADGQTGFLVPPGDVPAWAARVSQLVSDPLLAAQLGQTGRQRAEKSFSVQVTTARTMQLYHRLVFGTDHKQGAHNG